MSDMSDISGLVDTVTGGSRRRWVSWSLACWLFPLAALASLGSLVPQAASAQTAPVTRRQLPSKRWIKTKGFYEITSPHGVVYHVRDLGKDWQVVPIAMNDFAVYNNRLGGAMQINVNCDPTYSKTSLKHLHRQVMQGMTAPKIVMTEQRKTHMWKGIYSRFTTRLSGIGVKGALLVLKHKMCVFDINYVSLAKDFPAGMKAFDLLAKHFYILSSPATSHPSSKPSTKKTSPATRPDGPKE